MTRCARFLFFIAYTPLVLPQNVDLAAEAHNFRYLSAGNVDPFVPELMLRALDMALLQRSHEGVILHSDQGSQGGFNRAALPRSRCATVDGDRWRCLRQAEQFARLDRSLPMLPRTIPDWQSSN
ncbi:hypothetical protein [Paraburkholderia mimosarum]|uniref:hypothetical protein n=1 Tax=Paraburkholderia mimosarum TaxID=312026 RepID=UPI0004186502|nr:hypothetical protein [Paraburkholderia mimosarum]